MKQIKWTVLIVGLLVLCGLLFFALSVPYNRVEQPAVQGVLDAQHVDFANDILPLRGQWDFYYGQLLTPDDFAAGAPTDHEHITLPDSWDDALDHPLRGYATYRLQLTLPAGQEMMLFVPEIDSSAVVFINGVRVLELGTVGTSADAVRTACVNRYVPFVSQGDNEIVVQVANYRYLSSGLTYALEVGDAQTVLDDAFVRRTLYTVGLGCVLLLALYHLFLFFFRRKERIYLLFALMNVTVFLQFSLETNGLWQLISTYGIDLLGYQIYLALYALHLFFLFLFTKSLFGLRFGKFTNGVCLFCFLSQVVVCLILPPIYSQYLPQAVLSTIGSAIVFYKAVRAPARKKEPLLNLHLFSCVLYFVFLGLFKMLLDADFYMPGLPAILFMLLSQCIILAQRYASAFVQVEALNQDLEQLDDARTAELTQTNAQLRISQQTLKEMLGNISHDLKTPLTVLSTHLELLNLPDDDSIDATARGQYAKVAYNKAQDLQRLINNLFAVTRMETGRLVYHTQWMSSAQLLDTLRLRYADEVAARDLTLDVVEGGAGQLWLDPEKVLSVFDNLIYNALRYTPPGGRITLTAQPLDASHMQVRVCDTGCGIAPQHLPRIFERFYKVDDARSGGDSGLGLYIVKTTMEHMDGAVDVHSTEGVGTTFLLTFCAYAHTTETEEANT